MADFSTHVFAATGLCSFGATCTAKLLGLPMAEGLALGVAGLVGGVLPDIDLKVSWPSRLLFTLLGGIAALGWLFASIERLSALELWFAALAIFLLVRYPLRWLFHSLTVHRGALHSLAATAMAGLLTCAVASRLLGADAAQSWRLGLFLGAGYLLHLVLDEVYSVDFTGMTVKRSFGSALKPIDLDRASASAAVLLVALLAAFLVPDIAPFLADLRTLDAGWREALLPGWLTQAIAGRSP